jgi:hypothetical protein
MAQQIVDPNKLTEAQEAADAAVEAAGAALEAADAAVEAATLAAEKVAEVRGDDTTPQVANLEKPEKVQEAGGDGINDGYRIIQNGPQDWGVEGVFRRDGAQRFSSARGFPSEAAARQWINAQLAAAATDPLFRQAGIDLDGEGT